MKQFLRSFRITYFSTRLGKLWHKDSCYVRSLEGTCECGFSQFFPVYESLVAPRPRGARRKERVANA